MRVKIHREGLNIIFALLFILIVVNSLSYAFIDYKVVPIVFIVISVIMFGLVVNFFRLPRRHFEAQTPTDVVASVDGTVVALEEVYEDEYLHRNMIQLSIFMSVFNVHANWTPVEGEVKYVKHHAGRFMAAYLPKSSSDNERSAIVIKTKTGDEVMVRQIAGAVARRIVTYVEPGDTVAFDNHIGFIKFGSRVDVFLPLDTEFFVKLGDRTWGGQTLVARMKDRKNQGNVSENQE